MSAYLEQQGYCNHCERNTLARGRGVNHVLHLLLSLFCCAVWPFVWGALCLMPVDWRCSRCGGRVRMPAGLVQLLGVGLLVAGLLAVAGTITLFVVALTATSLTPTSVTPPPPSTAADSPAGDDPRAREPDVPANDPVAVKAVTDGPIMAEIVAVEVRPVKLVEAFTNAKKEGPECLIVRVRFTNSDDTLDASKAVFYSTGGSDEFGNTCEPLRPSTFERHDEPNEYTAATPDKPALRTFVFGKPIARATRFKVTIHGSVKGASERKFSFPFTIAVPKEPAKPMPSPKDPAPTRATAATTPPRSSPPPKPDTPATKPEPKPEKKPEPAKLPTVTLTPPKGETIVLADSKYVLANATKDASSHPRWEKAGVLRKLAMPTDVELVGPDDRNPEYTKVKLDGKEWYIESRWVPAEKK